MEPGGGAPLGLPQRRLSDRIGEPESAPEGMVDQTPADVIQAEPIPDEGMMGEIRAERAAQQNLPRADHPNWAILRRTKVTIDQKTQLFRARHPPEVNALRGKAMTLRGYMLPLEPDLRTGRFLISPYTPVCLFHPPAEPNEVVEVRLTHLIPAGYHLLEVRGRLVLQNNGEMGLFFGLAEAKARIIRSIPG